MDHSKLAIFDLDDTLVDTRRATLLGRIAAIDQMMPDLSAADRIVALDAWQRLTWFFDLADKSSILKGIAAELNRKVPGADVIERVEQTFENVLIAEMRPVEGCAITLSRLTELGVALGLVSNGGKTRQMTKLRASGLQSYFPETLIRVESDRKKGAKPYPTALLEVCEAASVSPEQTLAVGDRVTDVIAGNLAGCRTVLFYGRGLEARVPSSCGVLRVETPRFSIQRISELVGLLTCAGSGRSASEEDSPCL